jgi:glutamate-1-semialdehyde 2,1-aminomutase
MVYQAGTLSGNPIAMTAGIATLEQLKKDGVYESLEKNSSRLAAGLAGAAQKSGVAARVGHVGSMLGMFFTDQDVVCFDDAKNCDLELFSNFYQGMRQQGVYIAPSQFEALFLSTAHADEHIDATVNAVEQVLKNLDR